MQCDATEYAGAFASLGTDNSFSMENFSENFKINVLEMDDEQMVTQQFVIRSLIEQRCRCLK